MYILFYLGPNTFVISLPYWPVPYQTKYLPPFPSLVSSSPPMIKHVPPFNLPFSPFYSSPFTFLLFLLRRNISPHSFFFPYQIVSTCAISLSLFCQKQIFYMWCLTSLFSFFSQKKYFPFPNMFYFPYISADLKVSMAYTKSESEIAEFAAVQMKLQL